VCLNQALDVTCKEEQKVRGFQSSAKRVSLHAYRLPIDQNTVKTVVFTSQAKATLNCMQDCFGRNLWFVFHPLSSFFILF